MILHIRLFALMAQDAGATHIDLDFPAPPTLAAVQETLRSRFPAMRWPAGTLVALNQEYISATPNAHEPPLNHNDEIAIIPPVSGGCCA
jgi:molybdopterin converting factor small subunit